MYTHYREHLCEAIPMFTFYQRYMTVCQMKTLTVQNTLATLQCAIKDISSHQHGLPAHVWYI